MRRVEKAARAELRALPAALRTSTLAAAVLELAERLDAEPSDREASQLARELRLSLGDRHRRAGLEPDAEVIDVGAAEMGD
jgi:hypothetical protein